MVKTETICVYSHKSEEEYGSWSQEYNFNVIHVSLEDSNRYTTENFTIPGEINSGDEVFVLYMIYSSGDSFGSSSGNGEVLWVFTDKDIAEAASKIWAASNEIDSVSFKIEDGSTVTLSNQSSGYFENISNVEISSFIVNKKRPSHTQMSL